MEIQPANPVITMSLIGSVDRALRNGERASVVRFVTEVEPRADEIHSTDAAVPATRWISAPFPDTSGEGVIRIRGAFAPVADLQDGFKDLGRVRQDVRADESHAGGPTYRRLQAVLLASPGRPVLLLAVGVKRSTSIVNADLIGPLREADVDMVIRMAEEARRPAAGDPVAWAEGLLASPNPWLNWLGLSRLREARVLGVRHFRQLIEARPPEDTERLAHEMVYGSAISPSLLKAELADVEALIELPGKQMAILRELENYIGTNPEGAKTKFDMRKFHDWLVEYDKAVVARGGAREVSDAVQKLLRALPE